MFPAVIDNAQKMRIQQDGVFGTAGPKEDSRASITI